MTAGKSRLIINKVKMIVLSDFKEPDSAIRHQQNNTKAVMDQRELGVGTLYITESMLSWQGPQGFSIEYPHISLHALSKDTNLYPTECLYLMIDKHVKLPDDVEQNDEHDDDDEDSDNESDNDVSELIFVPEDKSALQPMYDAIKHCQELHPDPVDASTDEDEAFEDMMEDAYDDMEAAGDGNENVPNMQNLRIGEQQQNGFGQWDHKQDMDEDQFEDAD